MMEENQMRRLLGFGLAVLGIFAVAAYALVFWPIRNPHPAVKLADGVLVVRGAKVYLSPDSLPIEGGTVVVRNGRVAAVGKDVAVPADAVAIPCDHCIVTAGFWNAHVHFTEPKWNWAAWKSPDVLNVQLADMLISRGFTTVVDVGSDLRVTLSLRRRTEAGELAGPKIYTAGSAQYPHNGIPFYVKKTLPAYLIHLMPQPASPEEAGAIERRNIAQGADLLKLFTGSIVEPGQVLPMSVANAHAAVDVAHARGQLAFCHPSNLAGVRVAMESGVDVLAHAPSYAAGVDAALLGEVVARHMSMVPTLKMFGTTVTTDPAYLLPIYAEVRKFHELGGQLLVGTDVGYMTDYRTEDEFRALAASGLGANDILRMLTTAPAERFGVAGEKGTIAPGKLADLVVLSADPAQDVTNFARVQTTIRSGKVIFQR
jgi:imidazolonepropionase-like amidohydrolase